jgi:uncharacterized protein (DUF362 family)
MKSIKKSIVGITKLKKLQNKFEIRNSIFNLLNEIKDKSNLKIPPNSNIMIKPNICLVRSCYSGVTVDPFIVKCLVDWLLKNYNIKMIYIGEADATQLNIDIGFKILGWEETFSEYKNVKLINLTNDELININLQGLHFENLNMSKTFMDSDFLVSVGKLKTHTITGLTCILKNQYGANPVKYKAQYHKDLDNVIVDLNSVKIPDLCLVDGIICMEGKGPTSGIPKPMGLLIAGNDPLATDHACAKIMGLNPKKISHLNLAFKKGLSNFDYNTFGEKIESVKTNFKIIPTWKKVITNVYGLIK